MGILLQTLRWIRIAKMTRETTPKGKWVLGCIKLITCLVHAVLNPSSLITGGTFDYLASLLCIQRYCKSDGVVPIGSALFEGADHVRRRQIQESCDHDLLLNGEYNVEGGIGIFDQISADLITVVQPATQPSTQVSPAVQTTQAAGFTSTTATLNATISNTGSGTIVDARFEYTTSTFPGTPIYSVPVAGGQV